MFKSGLMALTLIGVTITAQAQHTVSSGGDYIREIFEKGRVAAVQKISKLNRCAFDPTVVDNTREWILKNQKDLTSDIQLSSHMWVVDAQPTCAFTAHQPGSPVYLSYPTCNFASSGVPQSTFTLIHEAAHHLGVHDEKIADEIAQAIMNASEVDTCSDAGSVYDPAVCQGPVISQSKVAQLLQPGQIAEVIGNYGLYTRARLCTKASGCGAWHDTNIYSMANMGHSSDPENKSLALQKTYPVQIYSYAEAPFYNFRFQSPSLTIDYGKYNPVRGTFTFEPTPEYGLLTYPLVAKYYTFEPNKLDAIQFLNLNLSFEEGAMQGVMRENCGWFSARQINDLGRSVTQETEIVLYGQH